MHAGGVCAGVQYGGAIAVFGSNSNKADLASLIMSGNQAKRVRGQAEQKQGTKHLCMLRLVLLLSCWCMRAKGVWEKGNDRVWRLVFSVDVPLSSAQEQCTKHLCML